MTLKHRFKTLMKRHLIRSSLMTIISVILMSFFFRVPFSQLFILFIGIFIGNLSVDITQMLAIKKNKIKRFFGIPVKENIENKNNMEL